MLLTIDKRGSKLLETVFSIAICRQLGDKWQSKTLSLAIFDLHSSIVLTFSIAAYPVCSGNKKTWTFTPVIYAEGYLFSSFRSSFRLISS